MKFLRKSKKQTQQTAAHLVGVGRTTWIHYEQGKFSPKLEVLESIADQYQTSVGDLLYSKLWETNQETKTIPTIPNPGSMRSHNERGIPLVPFAAQAGYLNGYGDPEFLEELPLITLPEHLHGHFRAFPIQGYSMPPIHEGFVVIGSYVENSAELTIGRRYIFVTKSEGIVFKRLAGIEEKQNLILSSDNPEYPAFTILFEDILEIWSFYSFIGYPEDYHSPLIELNAQLDRLEQILHSIDN